jgi:hypothetical protein
MEQRLVRFAQPKYESTEVSVMTSKKGGCIVTQMHRPPGVAAAPGR